MKATAKKKMIMKTITAGHESAVQASDVASATLRSVGLAIHEQL